MKLVKSIEQRIKINKIVTISALIFSVVVIISTFFYTYTIIRDSRKSMYVLDNGIPVLVKQTDELLNREVEYKAQVELYHKLFLTLVPDDKYIRQNIEDKALYLIDDSGKKEYNNLKERGFYNQLIASNTTSSVMTDSILLNLNEMKFTYYGKQALNRRSQLIIRKFISEGFLENTIRTEKNPHGVILKYWRILDNAEISKQKKYY